MPKIEVWECPKTGSFFKKTIDYRRHRCRLAADRRFAADRKARRKKADDNLIALQHLCTFYEIEQWLETNARLLLERQLMHKGPMRGVKHIPKNFALRDVKFRDMRWNVSCSNSHSAPRGKKTNWGGKSDEPRGYPGWKGRIHFKLFDYPDFPSHIFDGTGINTGTGGGSENGSYEVTLFLEDFPGFNYYLLFDETDWDHGTNKLTMIEGSITRLPSSSAPEDA